MLRSYVNSQKRSCRNRQTTEREQQERKRPRGHNRTSEPYNLVDIHLRRTVVRVRLLLLLGVGLRLRRLLASLRGLCALDLGSLRLGLGQDGRSEVDDLVLLLQDLRARQHRVDVLRPLALPDDLVVQPLLHRRDLLDDSLLVLRVDVRVLVVVRGRLGQVQVDGLAQLADVLRALFGFLVAESDGVAEDLEAVELGDVDGLGGVLAFLRVEPVLGFLESSEELGLLRGLDEGGVAAVELAASVVDVLLKSVLTILLNHI